MEDFEENFFAPNSWIPIKTLKRLVGFDEFISFDDPCSEKNFSDSKEFTQKTPFFPEKKTKKQLDDSLLKEEYIKSLEFSLVSSENKNYLLKKQLQTLENRNLLLTSTIQKINQEHMIKLQNLQEQHERKLQKTKKDLDFLLKEMNRRSNQIIFKRFLKIHQVEISRCRANYEDLLEKFVNKDSKSSLHLELSSLHAEHFSFLKKLNQVSNPEDLDEESLSTALNSERTTIEMKRNSLQSPERLN
jgi:hypothetical protein